MLSIEAKRKRDALFRNYASNVDFVLNTPLHEQRRVWEEGAMNVPLPENVSTEEIDEEGISAEWVRHSQAEKRKVILYLHGGGNSQGSSITHRKLVGHIVHCANVNALTLNYSLAPENPFPAGLMDAKYAWQWLLAQGIGLMRSFLAVTQAVEGWFYLCSCYSKVKIFRCRIPVSYYLRCLITPYRATASLPVQIRTR